MYGTSAPADACDAPRPGDRMSRTVTDAPRTVSSSATAAPTTPAPITSTFTTREYPVVALGWQDYGYKVGEDDAGKACGDLVLFDRGRDLPAQRRTATGPAASRCARNVRRSLPRVSTGQRRLRASDHVHVDDRPGSRTRREATARRERSLVQGGVGFDD